MRFFSMHEARQMLDEVSLGFTAASSWLPEPEWRRVKGDLEAVIERTISNHFV